MIHQDFTFNCFPFIIISKERCKLENIIRIDRDKIREDLIQIVKLIRNPYEGLLLSKLEDRFHYKICYYFIVALEKMFINLKPYRVSKALRQENIDTIREAIFYYILNTTDDVGIRVAYTSICGYYRMKFKLLIGYHDIYFYLEETKDSYIFGIYLGKTKMAHYNPTLSQELMRLGVSYQEHCDPFDYIDNDETVRKERTLEWIS